ncbi:hypothetical protein T459_28231 [Capsicum annuum]|uniref:Uncharacterized protein n=1 Tax=Capsicum annuum TaxID=4072 RepID=A0A2G2YG69_CAPAN|nr:hypothetical protein T459_28231 [Capsicum annuum]
MSPSPAPSGPPGYNIPNQITAANVAKECLLAALKADSKAAHIWTNLANAYYLMSDNRSSAKCLEKEKLNLTFGDMLLFPPSGMQNLNEQLSWVGSEMEFTASNV